MPTSGILCTKITISTNLPPELAARLVMLAIWAGAKGNVGSGVGVGPGFGGSFGQVTDSFSEWLGDH